MSGDSAVSIAWDLLKWAVTAIKRPIRYVMSSKSFADSLQEEVENLDDEVRRVNILAEQASNSVRKFRDVFTRWEKKSDDALKEVRDLLGNFENATKTCCYGTLPDPKCRYQFSRKAEGKIEVIKQLAQKCREFKELNDMSFGDPAPGNVTATNPARKGKDVVQSTTATASASSVSTSNELSKDGVFESRTAIIRDVMGALADNSNSVVGVYGMGGVGKSTLLDDVVSRIREEKRFDLVAKADVSQNPDIKRIQSEIAHALGLDMKDYEYESMRADRLLKRLKNEEKKVLIILDNLWEGLDLKSVGIPCRHDNKVIGCKLLLTSRDRNVLQKQMGCDKDFLLNVLEEKEAKTLFGRMVGDQVHDDEFRPMVDEALRKCGSLPLLIVAMAKHLKYADPPQRRDAFYQIEGSTNEDISGVINKVLQLSYDYLNNEDAKSLLQLCVAYGVSKPSIENLMRYGYGLGIFRKDSSIERARDRLRTLIRILQASSLLLDNGGVDGFKIHDLVRDFVAQFIFRDRPLLVLKDEDMSATQLLKERLKNCMTICFPYIDMKELPKELDCPELRIFLLFNINKSLEVPYSYFNSMKKLAVLNLTSVRLTHSPMPFQFLENLHTLCLQYCLLENVAILGKLKGLQVLSCANSNFQQLPKEIGQLTELRLLDLSYCSHLQMIEPGVLGRLIKLEELYMENSFYQWNPVEQTQPTNASLIELNHLKNLCTLRVSIPSPSVLPEELDVKKLTKYKIQIGYAMRWSEDQGSKILYLELDPMNDVLRKGCIQSILSETDDLFLAKLNGSEQGICALSQEGFSKLKHLLVKDSLSIHHILQRRSLSAFEMLESLILIKLINLTKICSNHIYSSKSFSRLKVIRVESCDTMEVLFPLSLLRGLPQLESIEVVSCKLMRGIVDVDDCGKVDLQNLHVMKLQHLPNIKNFFTAEIAPSSSTSEDQVGTQIAFFNGQQVAFQRLEKLKIIGLDSLEFIIFPSMVKSLTQLKELTISYCEKMEAIIMEEEGLGMETSKILAFPMLTDLCLKGLESLTCFSRGKCARESRSQDRVRSHATALFNHEVAFQRLEKLKIIGLDSLEFIFFPSMVKYLTQLKELTISDCEKMEAIVMEEEGLGMETSKILAFPMLTDLCLRGLKSLTCFSCGKCAREGRSQDRIRSHATALFNHEVAFQRLEKLKVIGLDSLEFIFIPSMVKSLTQLKELTISDCEKMEAIVMEKEGLGMETSKISVFPKLTNLCLKRLKSLTCFSRGKCAQEGRSQDCIRSRATALFNHEVAFHRLEKLEIIGLDSLEFTFIPSMVKSLTQLKELIISDCEKTEAIVMEEEGLGMETSEILAFPMLTDLCLRGLKSLTCFSRGKFTGAREGRSQDRVRSRGTTIFNHEVAFPNLENLYIKGMDNIEMIWHDQIPTDSFSKLKLLSVKECKKLVNVVPSFILGQLLSLETLKAKACASLEVIFKLQPLNPLDGNSVAYSPLKELKLNDLSKLNCVWDKELYHHIKFQCLRLVTLQGCARLTSLFLASIARDLIQLGKLEINRCSIVEFIEKEGPDELSINMEAIEGPSHGLKVTSSFPSYFQHMKTLDVSCCHGLSNMFTPTMAINLVELTTLRISKCEILTEVISDEEGGEGHVVAFNQLKYMELDGLTRLRCFSSSGYTLMFPLLEDIIVNRCPDMKFFFEGPMEVPKLERVQVGLNERYKATKYQYFWKGNLNMTIQNMFEEMATFAGSKFMRLFELPELIVKWHSELNPITSSWQLESLVVDKCPSFINAIPSSLLLVLDKLSFLQVCDCELLEEIFYLQGLEAMESTRVLPHLKELNLANLPKLRRLWNKNLQESLRFNSLGSLILYNCNNLGHAFAPSMARCLANLENMEIKECGQMEGVIIEEEGQGSAVENITFLNLLWMKLECLPNLTCFILGKNHTLECPKLETLSIVHCPKMGSLIGQSRMENDHSTPSLFTSQVQFPQLEGMVLSHMDKLSKIWTDSPQETLTFDCLWEVEVQNCKNLENLFPYWVATSLTQLDKLQVESCRIEEIVGRDDTPHSNATQVLFPELTSVVLHDMPRLQSFYANLPTLNWPFLKELRVTHCDALNVFSFVASMNSCAQRDDQQNLSDQEAHSSFERDFPKLERLLLVDNNIQMIRDGNFPDDIFSKPKALTLACFHDEKPVFPPRFFLERFRNLQSLEVFCSSFEDMFPDEGLVDEGKHSVLENLRELKLNKLHKLKSVWREEFLVSKILQSIETLEVWDCPCLTTIFSTMTSFQNLTKLVVKNSSGLVHLATVLTITNVVHLEQMTITGCERMKEVVSYDGDGEEKVICFKKLKRLTLQHLPSLECFSSIPSYSFRFPSLLRIVVEGCPKMKTFSKHRPSTRRPYYVSLFRYEWKEWNWGEGGEDLNTTIQKLSA